MPTFKGFVNKSVTCSTQKGNYLPSKTEIKDLSKIFSRAQNRIMYLRKMIITGRGRRCFQLKLVAREVKEGKGDHFVTRGGGKLQSQNTLLRVKALLVEQLRGNPGAG